MKNTFKILFFLGMFSIVGKSYALSVDSMLLVGDKEGNGVFTLTNDDAYTSYVVGSITKLDVQGKRIVKTPYNDKNLTSWEITLSHPKLIIEPGLQKNVGIRSLCVNECDFEKDHVYQVNFAPSPYSENEGEVPVVALNVGYAPLYIIPAKESKISYSIENRGSTLHVNNTGNTFIRVGIDQCDDKVTRDCRTAFTVLSGREKSFDLPEGTQSDSLNVVVLNHDNSYVRRIKLNKE
ncbi:TPA: hypothetical protein ACX3DH_003818 [Vibrio parahaemolyticus]|uniref:hypothetical protein n=1 Tax=Vibrio alginolyticus TaxID=663 RepID=UPI001BD32B61|nr:hypothetical protein [Vibrio alginolyticus]MBS9848128.1 hypothetical protein [Vibrio alginolyticus]